VTVQANGSDAELLIVITLRVLQYTLPMDLFNEHTIDEWIQLIRSVLERPVPEETLQVTTIVVFVQIVVILVRRK